MDTQPTNQEASVNNPNQARDRSYRVRDSVPAGSLVRTNQDAYYRRDIPAGEPLTVKYYDNAGFSGIHAICRDADGEMVIVSAGILEVSR